jgi:hypothetical protein
VEPDGKKRRNILHHEGDIHDCCFVANREGRL